jgi:Zn-dependent oligopeptidase
MAIPMLEAASYQSPCQNQTRSANLGRPLKGPAFTLIAKSRSLASARMMMKALLLLAPATFLTACIHHPAKPASATKPGGMTLDQCQARAAQFRNILTVPSYETSPAAVWSSLEHTIATADAALDKLGKLSPEEVTFNNTVNALDTIMLEPTVTANRLGLVRETSQNPVVRKAAVDALKKFSEWAVQLDYREDVYAAIKAFADRKPELSAEEARLLDETLRDYRRAGLGLPRTERDEVERLRIQLAGLTTDFETNINEARGPVKFTRKELAGVPDSFLSQEGIKTGPDEYTLMANVTFHYLMVMENAKVEATRQRFQAVHYSLAKEANTALLRQILELRDKIARKLGYANWADYEIEPKMAKTSKMAIEFLENLKSGLKPKLDAELTTYRDLKIRETGDPNAQLHIWDLSYFANQLKKEKYNVDAEQLRDFFPLDRTLNGMFAIYQNIFGLKFERIEPPAKWVDDLQLWVVSDAKTAEPLGLFYLDLFPRDGKYNHFAVFPIVDGKRLADGRYQRPTVAMVCNFPPPQPGKPSLMAHDDVVTLFHEFGHVMHNTLTRSRFARFAGANVPRDFVEAPSQMLENWAWDKDILDTFAADWRDPAKKIPGDILAKLREADLATKGLTYTRQVSFGQLDLALHTQVHEGTKVDPIELSNQILSDSLPPVPEGSSFATYFGHLMGYGAGYYGYAWADVISADMASKFENAPGHYMDANVGKQLRNEIYAVGNSRDPSVSIETFLGRPQSNKAFLKKVGIAVE